MEFQRSLSLLFLVVFSIFLSSSEAYRFYVGGNNGWIVNPSEKYNHWAERNRFQINDTLFFKYERGSDSVLVVSKKDYENCYTKNPIMKLDNGDSEFKLERSGPFYFISGKDGNCEKGQKLIVVVLTLRSPPPPPSPGTPSSSPFPAAPEPSTAAPPSTPPSSPSPGPQAPSSGSPLSPSPTLSPPSPTSSPQSPSSTTQPSSSPSESTLAPPPSGSSTLTITPSATLALAAVTVMVWTSSNALWD